MKKGLRFFILSTLVALLFLISTTSSALAATTRVSTLMARPHGFAITRLHRRSANRAGRRKLRGRTGQRHDPGGPEYNNQSYRGSSNSGNIMTFRGHDQNNTGNSGFNRGFNQDNSSNGGNQIMHRHRIGGRRRINQFYHGNSNNHGRTLVEGYNQNNTGNAGRNDGFNQDNSSNGGNQAIN